MGRLTINSNELDKYLVRMFKHLKKQDAEKVDEFLNYMSHNGFDFLEAATRFIKNFPSIYPTYFILFLIDEGWEPGRDGMEWLSDALPSFPCFLLDSEEDEVFLSTQSMSGNETLNFLYPLVAGLQEGTPVATYEIETLGLNTGFISYPYAYNTLRLFIFKTLKFRGHLNMFDYINKIKNNSKNIIIDLEDCFYGSEELDFKLPLFECFKNNIEAIILPSSDDENSLKLKNISLLGTKCKLICKGNSDYLIPDNKEEFEKRLEIK